ncbi:uncharacterized protein YALI1_F32698g [Yarrowia lipolytica]|uniref:Uncharacterized protein n=1 Tax=Yarrowia lipolytica TaxID=4952 RepID=A0A1D8NPX9_YARLL|nr:hypothetical protein YALI1_F32698g [Yarrowia lipolytica]
MPWTMLVLLVDTKQYIQHLASNASSNTVLTAESSYPHSFEHPHLSAQIGTLNCTLILSANHTGHRDRGNKDSTVTLYRRYRRVQLVLLTGLLDRPIPRHNRGPRYPPHHSTP